MKKTFANNSSRKRRLNQATRHIDFPFESTPTKVRDFQSMLHRQIIVLLKRIFRGFSRNIANARHKRQRDICGRITSSRYRAAATKGLAEIIAVAFHGRSHFILRVVFAFENNLDRTFGTHYRNLCGWPCVVDIVAQMLTAHHDIGATIGFAGNDRQFRHSRFRIAHTAISRHDESRHDVPDSCRVRIRVHRQRSESECRTHRRMHEACGLAACIDIEAACRVPSARSATMPTGMAFHSRKTNNDDLWQTQVLNLKEIRPHPPHASPLHTYRRACWDFQESTY